MLTSSVSTNKLKCFALKIVHMDQFKERKHSIGCINQVRKNYIIVTNFVFLINFVNARVTVRTVILVLDH